MAHWTIRMRTASPHCGLSSSTRTPSKQQAPSPLRPDLDAINACTTHEELAREMGRLMREGIGGLIGAYVGTDPHDSSRYMVSLVQSGIGLPDEAYYREDDYAPIREAYVAHTARLLDLAGHGRPRGRGRAHHGAGNRDRLPPTATP